MLSAKRTVRPSRPASPYSEIVRLTAAVLATVSATVLAIVAWPSVIAQTPQSPYVWKNVIIRGGGFVSGIVFSPAQKGLVYARTDVGGAYRSDDAGEHWVPITDGFGREQGSYEGIESLAVDPTDANRVYLASGMYSEDWGGPAAILRSSDKGRTWKISPLPLKMGGNDDGRNCGERLAVDPNMPSVLYFGSRKAGLWRSTDSGVTWARVDSFPVKDRVPEPWQKAGLTFVLFDAAKGAPGSPTASIYIGAAQAGASLYHSDDAGKTWQVVAGLPQGMFPSHAKAGSAGQFYFSFIDNMGPNGITNGAIMKYSAASGRWQEISPVRPGMGEQRKFGFGGLGVDAEHPDTLMVTTLDRWWPSDLIYRSTDAGKHWKEINTDAVFGAPNVPWVYWHKDTAGGTGWMSDIEIDPFNPDKVMYTTGAGIWGSADITLADKGKPTHWGFPNDGLEETVALALISPPQGVHLISGVGDIDGFRHEDLDRSPQGGLFSGPRYSNTESLDYAAQNPNLIVRAGRIDNKTIHTAYSTDDGVNWKEFASEPPNTKSSAGHIAISADGAVVIWTPDKSGPFWTDNMGKSWSPCAGIGPSFEVVSDRVNPNKFYSFDPKTGKLYESFDKGREFKERTVPVAHEGHRAFVAAVPGFDGDIWVAAGDNLYHSTDSGATFTAIVGMHQVGQLGFGKAAPGSQYPAIYLAGKWKDVDALYRSDDAGKNWVRLNDDRHQFGGFGPITGDPRVYGRVYAGVGGRGIVYGDLAGQSTASQSGGTN